MKTLKETVPGMLSKDWKVRLVAEIEQCDIRIFQLEQHLQKIGKDSPECSLLEAQLQAMNEYLKTLTTRASVFEVDYKLPSLSERMKNIPTPAQFDFSKCSNLDPMFWLLLMFFMSSSNRKDGD